MTLQERIKKILLEQTIFQGGECGANGIGNYSGGFLWPGSPLVVQTAAGYNGPCGHEDHFHIPVVSLGDEGNGYINVFNWILQNASIDTPLNQITWPSTGVYAPTTDAYMEYNENIYGISSCVNENGYRYKGFASYYVSIGDYFSGTILNLYGLFYQIANNSDFTFEELSSVTSISELETMVGATMLASCTAAGGTCARFCFCGCDNPDGCTDYQGNGPCEEIPGCTDNLATNYDSNANIDDGSCEYSGCMNPTATNWEYLGSSLSSMGGLFSWNCGGELPMYYGGLFDGYSGTITAILSSGCWEWDPSIDDGSCSWDNITQDYCNNSWMSRITGLETASANNFCEACIENNVQYPTSQICMCCPNFIGGCTDPEALNYNPSANVDDNSCNYMLGCTDPEAVNYNPEADINNGSCNYGIQTATSEEDCDPGYDFEPDQIEQYNPAATIPNLNQWDDQLLGCIPNYGCTDPLANNYNNLILPQYSTPASCIYKYKCLKGWGAAKGKHECVQDSNGEYNSFEECEQACPDSDWGMIKDPDKTPLKDKSVKTKDTKKSDQEDLQKKIKEELHNLSMSLNETIRLKLRLLSEEKVVNFDNPNNNFVVIAGGPGAGKSFITGNLINLDNVKHFNVDNMRVLKAKEMWGDDWEENISTPEGYEEILDKTFTTSDPRNLTVKFLKQFLQQERSQPTNVIYDAGGGQEKVMKDVQKLAKDAGFHTTLVYVRTPLDVAQQRNLERPRSLPGDMVAQYHDKVKDNMRNMIPLFDSVWTVDNKELIDLSDRPSDNIERIK